MTYYKKMGQIGNFEIYLTKNLQTSDIISFEQELMKVDYTEKEYDFLQKELVKFKASLKSFLTNKKQG